MKVTARNPRTRQVERVSANGRNVIRLKGLAPGKHRLKAVYTDPRKQRTTIRSTVVVRRR